MRQLNAYNESQPHTFDSQHLVAEARMIYRPATPPRPFIQGSQPRTHPNSSHDPAPSWPLQTQRHAADGGTNGWPFAVPGQVDVPPSRRRRSSSSRGKPVSAGGSNPRRFPDQELPETSYAAHIKPPPSKPLPLPPLPTSATTASAPKSPSTPLGCQSYEAQRHSLSSSSTWQDHSESFKESAQNSCQDFQQQRAHTTRTSTSGSDRSWGLPIVSSKMLIPEESVVKGKKKEGKKQGIHYLDFSASSTTLATKHGNNLILFWCRTDGRLQSSLKITSFTDARSRSRDYLIRSHAILSEKACLVAVAVKFGVTLEIWNWSVRKSLQTIRDADRWGGGRFEWSEKPWSQLAVYHAENATIDLWSGPGVRKQPLTKVRIIHLTKADLPILPEYPELAVSSTRPLLVAASGPRPPRRGHPPPDKETLLIAWDISENTQASHAPYRVARPYHNPEFETAIASDLVTYGDVVVSIWIPANFRVNAVRSIKQGLDYQLTAVPVPNKIVLVWDLNDNSTRIYKIPNTIACVSPDCCFVAYCDAQNADSGARGRLVIVDALTGDEVWSWPDPGATARDSGPRLDFKQFNDLNRVTELAFSHDSAFLVVGDSDGHTGVYKSRNSFGNVTCRVEPSTIS